MSLGIKTRQMLFCIARHTPKKNPLPCGSGPSQAKVKHVQSTGSSMRCLYVTERRSAPWA